MMMTQTPPAVPDPADSGDLDRALAHLVADGRLSDDLSHLIHDEYLKERAGVVAPAPSGGPQRTAWTSRLVEVGAYLGAALAAAGGALVVAQQWDELGRTGQIALFAGLTVVFGLAGLVAVRYAGVSDAEPSQAAVTRRLASTLLTLAAAAAAGLVVVSFVVPGHDMSEQRGGLMLLTMAAVAGAVLVAVRLVVPSGVAELALFGALSLAPMGGLLLSGHGDAQVPRVLVYLGFGVGYAALAMLTRFLTVPTLGVVLGLATALLLSLGGDPVNQLALAALAAGCFAAYLARPHWPLVTTAVLAAISLTFSLVGGRFGGALAMLAAGTVLLVGAAAALVVQRRHASGGLS